MNYSIEKQSYSLICKKCGIKSNTPPSHHTYELKDYGENEFWIVDENAYICYRCLPFYPVKHHRRPFWKLTFHSRAINMKETEELFFRQKYSHYYQYTEPQPHDLFIDQILGKNDVKMYSVLKNIGVIDGSIMNRELSIEQQSCTQWLQPDPPLLTENKITDCLNNAEKHIIKANTEGKFILTNNMGQTKYLSRRFKAIVPYYLGEQTHIYCKTYFNGCLTTMDMLPLHSTEAIDNLLGYSVVIVPQNPWFCDEIHLYLC